MADRELDPIEVVAAQLVAIRAMCDAALGVLGIPGDVEPDASAPCEHPEKDRTSAATSGNPWAYVCGVCQELIEPETRGE